MSTHTPTPLVVLFLLYYCMFIAYNLILRLMFEIVDCCLYPKPGTGRSFVRHPLQHLFCWKCFYRTYVARRKSEAKKAIN